MDGIEATRCCPRRCEAWLLAALELHTRVIRLCAAPVIERLASCMPCHPHPLTRPSAASPGITSAQLTKVVGQGTVVRRKAARGIDADKLLTARRERSNIYRTPVRTTGGPWLIRSRTPWRLRSKSCRELKRLYRIPTMGPLPRMTLQTLRVLGVLLDEPSGRLYGLEIAKASGLPTGTIYPILARLAGSGS